MEAGAFVVHGDRDEKVIGCHHDVDRAPTVLERVVDEDIECVLEHRGVPDDERCVEAMINVQ